MGISIWQLLIILLIILLLFGTKRLRTIGEDLGNALRSFRKGMQEDEEESKSSAHKAEPTETQNTQHTQETHSNDKTK